MTTKKFDAVVIVDAPPSPEVLKAWNDAVQFGTGAFTISIGVDGDASISHVPQSSCCNHD